MKLIASGYRADFERECERTNKLLAELLKVSTESVGAREKAALLEGKLSMLTQPWRRRLVDAFTLALPQVASNPRKRTAPILAVPPGRVDARCPRPGSSTSGRRPDRFAPPRNSGGIVPPRRRLARQMIWIFVAAPGLVSRVIRPPRRR